MKKNTSFRLLASFLVLLFILPWAGSIQAKWTEDLADRQTLPTSQAREEDPLSQSLEPQKQAPPGLVLSNPGYLLPPVEEERPSLLPPESGLQPSEQSENENDLLPEITPDENLNPEPIPPQEEEGKGLSPNIEEPTPPEREGDQPRLSPGEDLMDAAGNAATLAAPAKPWGDDGVIVYDYQQLADALSQDNGYNRIYFGDDISGDYSGAPSIPIHINKRDVIISGTDPETSVRHAFTTRRGNGERDGIHITESGLSIASVTFENMDATILNWYGICTADFYSVPFLSVGTDGKGFRVTMRNISATGPGLFVSPSMILRLEDVNFTSNLNGSGTGNLHEVAEIRALEIAGQVHIEHDARDNISMFWFRPNHSYGRYITVESGAEANLKTTSYFIAQSGSNGMDDLNVMPHAKLYVEALFGFRNNDEYFQTINVAEDASFTFIKMATNTKYGLSCSKLYVGNRADFIMKSAGGNVALLNLLGSDSYATFDNPRFVQLYNPAASVISNSKNGFPFLMRAKAINYWVTSATDVDSMDNMPSSIWNKDDTEELVEMSISYSSNGTGNVTHNLTENDPVLQVPNGSNTNTVTTRQIVMGDFNLRGDMNITRVKGTTVADADLKLTYGDPKKTLTGSADGSGNFDLRLPAGEQISHESGAELISHSNMLKARKLYDPDKGLYFIQVPDSIQFGTVYISAAPQLVPRTDPIWKMTVYDGRGTGQQWRVTAQLSAPLQTADGLHTLPNAMVIMDNGTPLPLSDAFAQNAYAGTTVGAPGTAEAQTDFFSAPSEGPMLSIDPGAGRVGQSYSTSIIWTLYDSP